jgi:AraC-like DNA-binding protein
MHDQFDSDSRGAPGQRIGTLIELARDAGTAPPVLRHFARQGRTTAAVAHVTAHFAGKIALDQAAALCRLSPTQFCRLFKMEQGVSFAQFLLRFRLERAGERLADSDVLVKEVAYAVGFNDLSYFARAFKRQFGVSPHQFQAGARSS